MFQNIDVGPALQRFSPFRSDVPGQDQKLQALAVDAGSTSVGTANSIETQPEKFSRRASEAHIRHSLIANLQASPDKTTSIEPVWQQVAECKQWKIEIKGGDAGKVESYRISNRDQDGNRQFYQLVSGPYGQPIIESEPDRAVTPPAGCSYVNVAGSSVEPKEKISGFICKDASGLTIQRFSLTNAANKKLAWNLSDDGCVTIDEKNFYLYALVSKDKNRMVNYDGFFKEGKPETRTVKILELEDLV